MLIAKYVTSIILGAKMSFFQNPFSSEFRGSLSFEGRQYSLTFSVPANMNKNLSTIAWNVGPYDLSTYTTLTFNIAFDSDLKNFVPFAINVSGATPSVTTAAEVCVLLNANTNFSTWFVATVIESSRGSQTYRILIKTNNPESMRFYISNTGAEKILRFNKYAGVAELPSYYTRHTIANRFNFTDSTAQLIELDETDATYDQPIITDAGFIYGDMKEDWELLAGRVGLFTFKKQTVDGSNRVTEIIEYSAGAVVGDMAKKTKYTYTAANTSPTNITQIPWTLESADLITP